jgi:hypothetical protein
VSSPVVLWQRFLTMKSLQLHALKSSPHRLAYRTDSVAPIVLKVNSSARTTQKCPVSNSTSIGAPRFVAAGKCLPSRCLETGLVYLPISRSSHSKGPICYNINIKIELLLQRKHRVSITNTNQLTLFREIIAEYFANQRFSNS